MSETNKDLQRRELVFRVLDDLKQSGERINADKVARLAQMGKQTVLPYYNEWRFLDDSEKEVDTDLPADLVRVLKRGLVQWKHEATEEQRILQEEANQEIDNLQEMNRQLSEERLNFKEQNEHLTDENKKTTGKNYRASDSKHIFGKATDRTDREAQQRGSQV